MVFSLQVFKFSLPIPSLSLPGGPGDVPIALDQLASAVGWYVGPHCLVDKRAQSSRDY